MLLQDRLGFRDRRESLGERGGFVDDRLFGSGVGFGKLGCRVGRITDFRMVNHRGSAFLDIVLDLVVFSCLSSFLETILNSSTRFSVNDRRGLLLKPRPKGD